MADAKIMDAVTRTVEILEPLSSGERQRVIKASLTLLGDEVADSKQDAEDNKRETDGATNALPGRAQLWMKQNEVSITDIEQVFHLANGTVSVIGDVPGKNAKEKVLNAYVITGIAKLLESGEGNCVAPAPGRVRNSAGRRV